MTGESLTGGVAHSYNTDITVYFVCACMYFTVLALTEYILLPARVYVETFKL